MSTTWPSGMVTFVLTDIEGSTRLLRRLGTDYEAVIDRHNALLHDAWERHDGADVSARGDSCLAAFGSTAAALSACADAQRQLADAPFPPDGRPKVRMGVHCGLALPRGGDYVALAVHQAARVAAAAHGGQVLASDDVAAAAPEPPGLALEPVGSYRLRDFDEPVKLHCLRGLGLDTNFPAVRAMPVDGHNFTAPATSFLGRAAEVAGVVAQLHAGRVVTLTGPGGVGKTRLALAAGQAALPRWAGGVWFVDVSPMEEGRLIAPAVAAAVGAPSGGDADGWALLVEHLEASRVLIILDNCEHLTADVAQLVEELLSACPGVGVLATSREPLAIPRELVWRVDPLPLPGDTSSVELAGAVPSVELFVERARSTRPGFALDHGNVEAVVALCRRLDGLPLALELAAAQTSVFGVHELLKRLGDRSEVLRSRQRGVPDRQRTMDAAVSWSLRLLDDSEQAVLRRLSVFRNGFSLKAAVVAAGDVVGCEVSDAVWSLADKSLVAVDLTANDTRYRLLKTVRAHLRRLLDQEGATVPTALRLAEWWLERLGPWQRTDRVRDGEIEVELDNLRAIVALIADHAEEMAQQLVCTIGRHYYAVHASRDAIGDLTRYTATLTTPSPARVSMLCTLGLMQIFHGDVAAARSVVESAEREADAVGAPRWDEVAVERAAGEVALRSGHHRAAAELARRTLARPLSAAARARMLNLLAIASYFLGDVDQATEAFVAELEAARELNDDHLLVIAEGNVAELELRRGDDAAAAHHQSACLELALALGRPVSVALSLIVAARLSAANDPERATELHAHAEALLVDNKYQLYDDDLAASTSMLDDTRRRLGDRAFAAACDRGRAIAVHDAVTLAQEAFDRHNT